MKICGDHRLVDIDDACVRSLWVWGLPPIALLIAILFYTPISKILRSSSSDFKPFLTLEEAEALNEQRATSNAQDDPTNYDREAAPVRASFGARRWRTIVLVLLGLLQTTIWLAYWPLWLKATDRGGLSGKWAQWLPFGLAFTWLYTALRPLVLPIIKPPKDLFTIHLVLLATGVLHYGGIWYEARVHGGAQPSNKEYALIATSSAMLLVSLGVILNVPFNTPNPSIKKGDLGRSVSPEDYITLWNWITFNWIYPVISHGRYATLNEDDIFAVSPTLQSRPVFAKFSAIVRSTLLRRLWAANSIDMTLDFSLTLLSVVLNYSKPFFLRLILEEIDATSTPEGRTRAYIYAFVAFVCAMAKAQVELGHLWFSRRASTRVRSELMAAIYDKALKRKDYSGITSSKREGGTDGKGEPKKDGSAADVGKIVNLMAGDANALALTISAVYMLYGAPLEIILATYFLYNLLGISAFAGFIAALVCWPLNSFLTRQSISIWRGFSAVRDKRMGAVNELISSIKFIKFFAWEDRWINRVLEVRKEELKWMAKTRLNAIWLALVWSATPIIVSTVSFLCYVYLGNQLTVATAFTALSLFNMIREPLQSFPGYLVQMSRSYVCLQRIAAYLEEDEVTEQVSTLKRVPSGRIRRLEGLGFENASFKWNEVPKEKNDQKVSGPDEAPIDGERMFELKDLQVVFPEGELTLVTGPTASGKTALLMAVLGEMTLTQGRIIMSKDTLRVDTNGFTHSISYAAQTPWLRHQSIKDNILFDSPLDEARYRQVIEACALKPDLDMLEDGDATEIGARGVSLSGGQKARGALARAVYARTKYVLLDDPLSAVDSHTSRHLYEKLLRGSLLANRTVVLVTHHVDLVLPGAHYLIRMSDGRVDAQGTVKDLRSQGILDQIKHEAAAEIAKEEADATEIEAVEATAGKGGEVAKKPKKLVADEHRETGSVKWATYQTYLKASSYWIWGLLVGLVVFVQLLGVIEKLWIMVWSNAYKAEAPPDAFTGVYDSPAASYHLQQHPLYQHSVAFLRPWHIQWPSPTQHPLFYIGVYAAIGVANTIVSACSTAAQYTGALRASHILFRQLLVTVVRATFRFHDTTPQGRMLNRFGKDIETIDSSLANSLQSVNRSLTSFFAAVITIAVVFPWFLVPAIFIGLTYRELAIGYLNTGRDLRRMEANTRSPIYSDFGEMLEGIVTVRAFSAERRFLDALHTKVDTTTKMWYTFWMTNRWLSLNFDNLSAISVYITMLFSIGSLSSSAGLAGLCITSAMTFTDNVYWACRFWTSLELDLNSVERVIEYLDLPQEPAAIVESNRPPAYWPSHGSQNKLLVVENLEVKYAPDLPSVLRGISCSLAAGERIGLLGRTGSGKSTLAMSLLRFVDPVHGRIIIDGIDISKIGVQDLRSRLTFIPQDATLFSGSIRDNLDPYNEHTDAECLDVLKRVHMISDGTPQTQAGSVDGVTLSSRPTSLRREHTADSSETASTTTAGVESVKGITLATEVSNGGANFSQGQRQLLAMARALLRRSSIIILDEATSSIDFETDAKIQAAIREEFKGSLLLTVAHRLRTVIDYDRLIVLEKGQIAEFDTPYNLLQNDGGIFKTMCLKSGNYAELEAAARAKSEGKTT